MTAKEPKDHEALAVETNGYPPTILAALAVLQGNLPPVVKDKVAEIQKEGKKPYSYKYAKLEEIAPLLLPELSKVGLSWSSMVDYDEKDRWGLHFELAHVSGGKKKGFWPINLNLGPQQIGSMLTYADRYALCKATGLAPAEGAGTDDDGAAAQQGWQDEQDAKAAEAEREVETRKWLKLQVDTALAMDDADRIKLGKHWVEQDAHQRGKRDVSDAITAADRKVLGLDPQARITLNELLALDEGYVEHSGRAVRAPDEDTQQRRDPDDDAASSTADPDPEDGYDAGPDRAADGANDATPSPTEAPM